MPRLWNDTIEEHRRAVRDAILETTWGLVTEHGLASVTMSRIALATGIGRATLYKYFPDVDAIVLAWHQRHVAAHLEHLAGLRDEPGEPVERLRAMLEAYAQICQRRGSHDAALTAFLHGGEDVQRAQADLARLFRDVIAEGAAAGIVRDDVPAAELARYCLHALAAASGLRSGRAVGRLVEVTLAGLVR